MAQELLRVIRHNTISELSQVLQRMNTVDIAKSMEELDDKSLVVVFRLLTKDTSAEVFSYLDKSCKSDSVIFLLELGVVTTSTFSFIISSVDSTIVII